MESRLDEQRLRKLVTARGVSGAELDSVLQRLLQAVREDERRRCARELHDETLQALGALRIQLSAASRSNDVETLHTALDGAVQELGEEIANLRALITDLRPASLDLLGLEPALHALFDRARSVFGLEVQAAVALDPGRLTPEVETAVYRVVQESITNAARHAEARRLEIEVLERHGHLAVRVIDDGRGFDPTAPRTGVGLVGMRERVALAGGRLAIRTSPAGTAVTVTLPATRPEPVTAPEPVALSARRGRPRRSRRVRAVGSGRETPPSIIA
jgi:signal transduction histidine kinase